MSDSDEEAWLKRNYAAAVKLAFSRDGLGGDSGVLDPKKAADAVGMTVKQLLRAIPSHHHGRFRVVTADDYWGLLLDMADEGLNGLLGGATGG